MNHEQYFNYYRDILRRIAGGWETPASLASMALTHVIHKPGCPYDTQEWTECGCGAESELETEEKP